MRRVPATVITGFLGAGKTSLVRHLLACADGRRLAVIVNEFGELGIDREILLSCGEAGCSEEDIVELANGCICCTVAEDFLPTLERLLDRAAPPEHILIETSGLALPKPLVQAFAWPEIRTRTTPMRSLDSGWRTRRSPTITRWRRSSPTSSAAPISSFSTRPI